MEHLNDLDPGQTEGRASAGQWELGYGGALEFLFVGKPDQTVTARRRMVAQEEFERESWLK